MASGSLSVSKGSDEVFLHVCDVCKYNNKISEAISFCTVCMEYLCKMCEQAHRGSKVLRGHKIITGKSMHSTSAANKSTSYCEHHKSMALDVYCVYHDDVICGTCKLTTHRKCSTTGVIQQTKNIEVRKAFDESVERIRVLQNKFETFKESRKAEKSNVNSNIEACLEDVNKLRKEINETMESLEKELRKEATGIVESMNNQIDNHWIIANDALSIINSQVKSLEECRKSKDEDVLFVYMKKVNVLGDKYETVLSNIEKEICPTEISFKPNDIITDLLLQLRVLGTIETKKGPSINIKSIRSRMNMHVEQCRQIDVRSRNIFDCTFIGDSYLVLACANDGLRLLDKEFQIQSQLSIDSWRLAKINENEVVVTQFQKQLQRVSIFPKMAVTRTLKMTKECFGVDVFDNEIYVTCNINPDYSEVRVLNLDGRLLRQLAMKGGQYRLIGPDYVKVIRDGHKVCVSDSFTDKVTCLSRQGHVLYWYTDRDLKGPSGMFADDEGTVLVCGEDSHNVHMISNHGRKQKILLSKTNGLHRPRCISYRPRDGCLVVGLWAADKPLLVYKTRID